MHVQVSQNPSQMPKDFRGGCGEKRAHGLVPRRHNRPEIDGLRALAVLLVVAFHAFPTTVPGGYVGVDVFFVISGYLITNIIICELAAGRFSIVDFYVRRIRRILPALILVLGLSLAFGYVALFPDEFKQLSLHVIGAATFVSNIILWREAGYFDADSAAKPLLHLWSLGIEEQFYLVWPFVLALGVRLRLRLVWLVAVLGLVSFAANVVFLGSHPSATFYLPFTRTWELLVGAFLALAPPRPIGRVPLHLAALAGLGALIGSVSLFTDATPFPGWAALLPTTGAALLILGGSNTIPGRALSHGALTYIGRISYPLYLWHWPLLSFSTIVNGRHPDAFSASVLVGASFLLAIATYHLIERPAQNAIGRLSLLALVPLALLVALGMSSLVVFVRDGLGDRPAATLPETVTAQFGGSLWTYSENDICRNQYASDWELFCIQNRLGAPTIMLVGNSYANHLYPGTVSAFPGETVLNIGTCDPATRGTDTSDCALQDAIVAASPELKLVILSSDWQWNYLPEEAAALRQRVEWMTSLGKTVVLFGPKFDLPFHVRDCFARPFGSPPKDCEVASKTIANDRREVVDMLQNAIKGLPRARYYDQNTAFCGVHDCSPIRDGLPLLRDNGHYSIYGSILSMSAFAATMEHPFSGTLRAETER